MQYEDLMRDCRGRLHAHRIFNHQMQCLVSCCALHVNAAVCHAADSSTVCFVWGDLGGAGSGGGGGKRAREMPGQIISRTLRKAGTSIFREMYLSLL